jgi:hypothetical protein
MYDLEVEFQNNLNVSVLDSGFQSGGVEATGPY